MGGTGNAPPNLLPQTNGAQNLPGMLAGPTTPDWITQQRATDEEHRRFKDEQEEIGFKQSGNWHPRVLPRR